MMKTSSATFCSASLPTPRITDPSPPLWGSAKSPVMGLPDFPVPDAGLVVELLLLSLLLLSVPVLGSLSSMMAVCAPLIQLSVQGVRSVRPNVILAKIHPDSHILREGCLAQRLLKRRNSIMAMLERPWVLLSRFSICLSVYVLFVSFICRCRMTLSN